MSLFDFIFIFVKVIVIFVATIMSAPLLFWVDSVFASSKRNADGETPARLRFDELKKIFSLPRKFFKSKVGIPLNTSKILYAMIPLIVLMLTLLSVAVVPFSSPVWMDGSEYVMQVADLRPGILFALAMLVLGKQAILLFGWASNDRSIQMEGVNAVTQRMSFVLSMFFAAVAVFLLSGSFELGDIVEAQGIHPWKWNVLRSPVAFVVGFAVIVLASMRMEIKASLKRTNSIDAMNVMRITTMSLVEYIIIFVWSLIIASAFLGGWQIPFVTADMISGHAVEIVLFGCPALGAILTIAGGLVAVSFVKKSGKVRDYEPLVFGIVLIILGVAVILLSYILGGVTLPYWVSDALVVILRMLALFVKTVLLCFLVIWIKWRIPQSGYDEITRVGWRILLPVSMANVIVTAALVQLIYGY